MIVYNTLKELKKDIVDNTLTINDHLVINFNLDMSSLSIQAWSISARNIEARNIDAFNINAKNIKAWDINAGSISAKNIFANEIAAQDLDSKNIDARNIYAGSIRTTKISYGAACHTSNLICDKIELQHFKGKKWSLYSEVIIDGKEQTQ